LANPAAIAISARDSLRTFISCLAVLIRSRSAADQRSFCVKIDIVDLDWPRNIFQVLTAKLSAREIDLALNEVQHLARNADPTASGNAFEASSNVHTVTEHVAIVFDHITDVDSDPEF